MESQKLDADRPTVFLRRLSVRIAAVFHRLGITPNQVTIGRFVIFGSIAAYCFYQGGHLLNVIGALALILNYIFDLVDGDLARNYRQGSRLGQYLESLFDPLIVAIVILAVSLGLQADYSSLAILGAICLFGQIFSSRMTLLFDDRFGINCVEGNPKIESRRSTFKRVDYIVIELINPHNFVLALFSNIRYYVLLGALLNILPQALLVYGFAINIRWALLAIFLSDYERGKAGAGLGAILQSLDISINDTGAKRNE